MIQDIRFAFRSLSGAPGFTVAAVLTLALGLAANTIVYGIVDALMLRPLPFGERSTRLITMHSTHPTQAQDWDDSELSYPDMLDIRESSRTLAAVEAVLTRNLSLSAAQETERVMGASVTPGLLGMLGVEPQLGRGFRDEDGAALGSESVVLISHSLWQRLYGGDPTIVGRAVPVNGRALTVIGVMPPRFAFPEHQDVWLPYRIARDEGRDRRNLLTIGLLRPDASLQEAQAEISSLASTLATRHPDTNRDWGVHLLPLRELFVGDRRGIEAMLAAVGLVLIVGCANVAGLMLARGVGRQRELSVRTALGASRARLVRLLLAESLLISIAGGLLAILIATWGLDGLMAWIPEPPPYWANLQLDVRVLGFVFALSVFTTIACGLLPALRFSRIDVGGGMLHGSRAAGSLPDQRALQGALVAGQVAMSFALLIGATLLARSAMSLQHADVGFNTSGILSLRTYIAGDAYDNPTARARAVDRLVKQLASLPGATAAAATGAIPSDDGGDGIRLAPERGSRMPGDEIGAQLIPATPSLFETLGIALAEGRTFTTTEHEDPDADVIVVNRALASRFWPGETAIGRTLRVSTPAGATLVRVVGVAPDLVYEELGEETAQSRMTVYVPYARAGWRTMALLVRSRTDPASLVASARTAVRGVDAAFAAYDVMTMTDRRRFTSWGERFLGRTFAAFAASALLLACLGVYGLTAYSAAQRTKEIGVRMAIGARPADILRLLLGRGTRLAIIGAIAGLPLAITAARLLEGLLFRVSPWNVPMWIALPVALVAAVLLASFLPARRASRIDPAVALRQE